MTTNYQKPKIKLFITVILLILIIFMINFYFKEHPEIGPMCYNKCKGDAGIVKGVNGYGMKFNNSVFLEYNNKSLDVIGSDNFTIDLWFKIDKNTIGDMFSKGYVQDKWIAFSQRNSRNQYQVWSQCDDNNHSIIVNSVSSFNDNKWHHAIIDYDRINNDWRINLYVDDKLENEMYFENYGLLNNTEPLYFGTCCGNKTIKTNKYGNFEYWGGLDEVKIYHKDKLIFYEGFNNNN